MEVLWFGLGDIPKTPHFEITIFPKTIQYKQNNFHRRTHKKQSTLNLSFKKSSHKHPKNVLSQSPRDVPWFCPRDILKISHNKIPNLKKKSIKQSIRKKKSIKEHIIFISPYSFPFYLSSPNHPKNLLLQSPVDVFKFCPKDVPKMSRIEIAKFEKICTEIKEMSEKKHTTF